MCKWLLRMRELSESDGHLTVTQEFMAQNVRE